MHQKQLFINVLSYHKVLIPAVFRVVEVVLCHYVYALKPVGKADNKSYEEQNVFLGTATTILGCPFGSPVEQLFIILRVLSHIALTDIQFSKSTKKKLAAVPIDCSCLQVL